jgi:hypothetical protein
MRPDYLPSAPADKGALSTTLTGKRPFGTLNTPATARKRPSSARSTMRRPAGWLAFGATRSPASDLNEIELQFGV